MTEQQNKDSLFSEFPPITLEEWKNKIKADLKGRNTDKLNWQVFDGFKVPPFFMRESLNSFRYLSQEPGYFPFIKNSKSNDWLIRQEWMARDSESTIRKIKKAVHSGTSEVCLDFSEKASFSSGNIENLLQILIPEKTGLVLKGGYELLSILKKTTSFLSKVKIHGGLDYDPLGYVTRSGSFYQTKDQDFDLGKNLFLICKKHLPDFKVMTASGYLFAEAGASLVQELAFGMAMIAEYLSELTSLGISAKDMAGKISLSLGVGPNYFMEIAKIRAARMLWTGILRSFDPDIDFIPPLFILSRPVYRNVTRFDPYTNILRYTSEVQSAALGGTDSIQILPFDAALHQGGNEFSERIARNTQIILKKEAYLEKVVDPGSGSYYIENLTQMLVENAWNLFLSVEKEGGYLQALKKGVIQDQIKKSRNRREQNVAFREEILLGTNHFPNLQDTVTEETIPNAEDKINAGSFSLPIHPYRAAKSFEAIRQRLLKSRLAQSSVVLFPYGNPSARSARITFAINFLGCGGFRPSVPEYSNNLDSLIKTCNNSQPRIVVFCSSDAEYSEFVFKATKEIGPDSIFIIAGNPGENELNYRKAGIRYFIHSGSNVLEILQNLEQDLRVWLKK